MVSCANMPRPSGTRARPRRAISCTRRREMSAPSYTTRPEAAGTSPVMARRVVVLPAPLAPMRHTSSPGSTVRSTPFTARMPP